ncbi:sn-glycerol-3-phosphate ABC transporter ATP-binding protein UgpC [bacterium]|nr:sn-glycerol-3-phosphate ABC transporter ATP-binding protein UgpC [bacterium]
MANVVFDHVKKQYGDSTPVIKDLNLRVEDKEFLVLVGPSGCGKSTALRMIAGLEDISGGFLSIGDHVVNDVHPKNRDIAMVFQNYALYPHMTCYENMAFALKLRKVSKDEIRRRVMDAAKSLEIEHLLERKPKALSGGQRQRVAIGRAIVREPKVFLMDEPLSNLDAKLRVSMRAEIKKLHQRLQTTFVYVTHDQTEAMTLGDRIAIMKAGDLQQCDTPHEVYNRPANLFVATFIGSPQMNLLDGTMRLQGDEAVIEGQGFKFVLPKRAGFRDGAVVVGIRPEHMTLVPEGEVGLKGQVEVTEPMGFESYVYLPGARGAIIARVSEEQTPRIGQAVAFNVEPAKIHVFDPQTELRLG